MDNKELNIYQMKLHQQEKVHDGLMVTRVPGGWIYETPDASGQYWSSCFVPFDNEFQCAK